MSRDWTPKELYYADKQFDFKNQKITMTDSQGNKIELGSSKEDRKKVSEPLFSWRRRFDFDEKS